RHPNYYDEPSRKQLTKEHGISVYEQKRDLVEIKEVIRPEYLDIASHVLQDVLFRLEKAYKRFFQRVKNGEKPGYPRFQGRNRYTSFTYPDGAGWKLDAVRRPPDKKGMVKVKLHLSKLGTVSLHLHRDITGAIKTLTMKTLLANERNTGVVQWRKKSARRTGVRRMSMSMYARELGT